MKFGDILRGHVPVPDDQRKAIWSNADFVFDTNVLLNVYRYTPESRAAFLKLLAALKGRVFIPHRVAVEFARNRIDVIREQFKPQSVIKKALEAASKEISDKHPKHPHLGDIHKLIESATKLVDDRFGEAEKKHEKLIRDDSILRDLLAAIGDDVGDPYPQADIDKEYKKRKDGMIPPFCKMDDDKDEVRRVGDVVIWLELLKKYEGTKKPLIFVTDDLKENWWHKSGGHRDPQPSLVQEVYERVKADILFYTAERFNDTASKQFGIPVPKALAEETKQIRQQEKASGMMELHKVLSHYFHDYPHAPPALIANTSYDDLMLKQYILWS